MKPDKQKLIVILGPTGSGKSELALKLARKFHGYLISADSQQIYRGSNIGSNKDRGEWKNGKFWVAEDVEEYLVDFLKPGETYSAAEWREDAAKIIKKNPDRLPIIVGGTGLYIDSLIYNFDFPGEPDLKLRAKLEKILEKKGIEHILSSIKKYDPDIEQKIDSGNPRRVLRAAEIVLSLKKPLSRTRSEGDYDVLLIGINLEKQVLYEKLNKRAAVQLEQGLIEETNNLLKQVKNQKNPLLLGVGNRHAIKFINKEITRDQLIELNARDNRRYAKRQLTWFKRNQKINWIVNENQAVKLVKDFIDKR